MLSGQYLLSPYWFAGLFKCVENGPDGFYRGLQFLLESIKHHNSLYRSLQFCIEGDTEAAFPSFRFQCSKSCGRHSVRKLGEVAHAVDNALDALE